jgi:hypothetical protein
MSDFGFKDDFKIRELYENILNKYAESNSVVILENLKILAAIKGADSLHFDGEQYDYDENTRPFCFIGDGSDLIGYIASNQGTHNYIFSAFTKLAAALKLTSFPPTMSYLAPSYENFKPSESKGLLKDDGVSFFGKLNKEDLLHFIKVQRSGQASETRRNTRAGRIWFTVKSEKVGKVVSVISFWCREKDVKLGDLKSLKKNFKLGDFFWAATDSKYFNAYTDDYRDTENGEIKELKSKIFPNLTHEEIVDILMRGHTGFRMSPMEQKVVWEFRGYDQSDLKQITGGYDTPAEYNYNSRLSESKE